MTAQVIQRDRLGVLTKIGQGGQGVVYGAPNVKTKFTASMVYKEYKTQTLADIDFAAVAAMPALVEDSLSYAEAERLISSAAWPCALVEDSSVSTGFVMPAIPEAFFIDLTTVKGSSRVTAEFQHLLNHGAVLAARGIEISDVQRYGLLREVASALAFLHKHGVCVGDISPKNLLFSLTPQAAAYFIDCDAMRINGVSALAQVETPGWEAPSGEELATIYTDTYKLGLLALRLLAGDHDTKNPQRLPTTTPGMLRQIIAETVTNQPRQRPLPEAWIYVLGNAVEHAQHQQKSAPAAGSVTPLNAPPAPVVRSRPSTPTPHSQPSRPSVPPPPAWPPPPPAARPAPAPAARTSASPPAARPASPPAARTSAPPPAWLPPPTSRRPPPPAPSWQHQPAPSTARRPGTVTAAAVMAFLEAAYFALGGVAGIIFASLAIGKKSSWLVEGPGFYFVQAFGSLMLTLLLLWGAVAGLRGTTRKVLFAAVLAVGVFTAIAATISIVLLSGQGMADSAVALVIVLACIFTLPIPLLLATRSSKHFFRARAGRQSNTPLLVGCVIALVADMAAGVALAATSVAPPVREEALNALLLTPEQVGNATGVAGMTVRATDTAMSPLPSGLSVTPDDCVSIAAPVTDSVYADSGFTAVRRQFLSEAGDNATRTVTQAAVLFPSAVQARAFFTASDQRWSACHQFTVSTTAVNLQSTVGPISNTDDVLSVTATPQNGKVPGWACQMALAVRNNVIIDVIACAVGPANSAVDIAQQISAKVPT